ncbi:MAG: thioredoxin family protein [Ferruginibacter sp.]
MKKIAILIASVLILAASVTYADNGITFSNMKNWKVLLARAKKEHKIIFLDAYASWCGPCQYLQKNIFTKQSVGKYFNATFINAKMDMEIGEGPSIAKQYEVTAYPTLFFIDGDGKVLHKYVGALEADELLDLGKDAINPNKQYYTVKEKATTGLLSPADFHKWAQSAIKMEDKDAQDIITKYINSGKYPSLEKDMLDIIFEDQAYLSKKQLKELKIHKDEIIKLRQETSEDFDDLIMSKEISSAIEVAATNENLDFTIFKNFIADIEPEKADIETQKMKVKYYFYKQEDSKALGELAFLISNKSYKLSVLSLATIVADNCEKIVEGGKGNEFIRNIQSYELLPEDIGKEYYKDYALLAIYFQSSDTKNIKVYANKIIDNTSAPDDIREGAKRLLKDN